MIETLGSALTSTEFSTGFINGTVASLICAGAALLWRVDVPLAGVAWAFAAATGLWILGMSDDSMIVGVTLLLSGGVLAGITQRVPVLRVLATAPGAWLLSRAAPEVPQWVPWAVLAFVVVASPLTASTDRHTKGSHIGTLLWMTSVAGLFATVPDTERALVLLGSAIPLAVLGLFGVGRLGVAGSFAAVGLFAWTAAMGGVGRPASIVGALACLGVFLVAPLARRIRSGAPESWIVLFLTHASIVTVSSRLGGLRSSVKEAALITGAALIMGLGVLIWLGHPRTRRVTDLDNRAVSS